MLGRKAVSAVGWAFEGRRVEEATHFLGGKESLLYLEGGEEEDR